MDGNSIRRVDDGGSEHVASDRERSGSTRRSFLKEVGKKTLYVTPVVMTLCAERAQASATQPSCGFDGSPCTTDDECCGCCQGGMCNGDIGCGLGGAACAVNADCCSNMCDNMGGAPTFTCDAC